MNDEEFDFKCIPSCAGCNGAHVFSIFNIDCPYVQALIGISSKGILLQNMNINITGLTGSMLYHMDILKQLTLITNDEIDLRIIKLDNYCIAQQIYNIEIQNDTRKPTYCNMKKILYNKRQRNYASDGYINNRELQIQCNNNNNSICKNNNDNDDDDPNNGAKKKKTS